MVRVLPYRSVDNFIGGVVITFTNLTPLTQAQTALRESEERLRGFAEASSDVMWVMDAATRREVRRTLAELDQRR